MDRVSHEHTHARKRSAFLSLLAIAFGMSAFSFAPSPRASSSPVQASRAPLDRLPKVMLWVWEWPDDLRDVARSHPEVGVAFLAQTITLTDTDVRFEPRRQPLRVAPETRLVAVTRVETRRSGGDKWPANAANGVAELIAKTSALPGVAGVQIDFDAVESERAFYRQLLERTRARLNPSLPLSMTALASWCIADPWLEGLPIDEAVPMLFRMGPANERYRAILWSREWARPECRQALGVDFDGEMQLRAQGRRVYFFPDGPWYLPNVDRLVDEARR